MGVRKKEKEEGTRGAHQNCKHLNGYRKKEKELLVVHF